MARTSLHRISALAALMVLFGTLCCSPQMSAYEGESGSAVRQGLIPVNYVTFWMLKNDGYHPCILIKVENHSGRNLTGERLRFQAIMVNLRNGEVTRGRMETRKPFGPKSRIFVTLVGNDPFELPISTSDWPSMECKVMARVGDSGDEGTQTLTVAEVERVAMREDDAMEAIEKMREYSQTSTEELLSKMPAKPMKAAPAGLLKTASVKPAAVVHKPPVQPKPKAAIAPAASDGASTALRGFLQPVQTPGLGDDFLSFEQKYGLPANTERVNGGWTWASYKHNNPHIAIYAGASTRKGVVDVLVAQVPANEVAEADISEIARLLSGKNRSQKLSTMVHSVRYLSAGRTELISAKASTYQLAYFTPFGNSHQFTIILSRIPGELESLLTQQTQHTTMLKPIASLFEP